MPNRDMTIREEVSKQIADIMENRVNDLSQLWSRTFGEQIHDQHMRALVTHVTEFFDDVFSESKNRQDAILEKIQSLHTEAEDLKRLLGVDINLNAASPDLPYYSMQCELDQNLEDLRSQLEERRDQIRAFLEEQHELVTSLEEKSRPLPDDPLPSEEDMTNFRRYLDDLKVERLRRNDVIRNLQHSIKILIQDLQLQLDGDECNLLVYSEQVQPTLRNISRLERIETELAQQFEDMKTEIDKYRTKLDQLWEFLQISPEIRQKFRKYTEYNQNTYDVFYQEFNRCESIKRENIEKYVHKIRLQIINYWDMCCKSTEERERFTPFGSQTYNEDLLTLHEMELAELEEFYTQHKPIFDMVDERKHLWEQMEALEKKKNDPNRYNNRGGQLLKEEKERKMINARIPKLESQLLELCAEYEARTNKPFTIDGRTVQSIIDEDYEKKEEEKASRKKVAGSTPMSVSRYAVGGRTPQTGSALKNMTRNNVMSATRTFSAAKRPLLSSATNSNMKRRLSPSSAKTTPAAKRNILSQMTSFARPMGSGLKVKSPAKGGLKRRSIKRLSIKSKRRLSKRRNENQRTGAAAGQSSDTSCHSESMTYDVFENYVSQNTPMRSSVLPQQARAVTPKVPPHIRITRTNSIARSPSPGGTERKKLTTKTIPIMF
ncbi:protein regulator of cytokinesis 1-like [Culicoides brevitarsis]|uniref:protein regulator of cytokinesis 1-like n=1 Tax=Culicoides brevitarsis TaxID=469753 RepID=UPI00307B9040